MGEHGADAYFRKEVLSPSEEINSSAVLSPYQLPVKFNKKHMYNEENSTAKGLGQLANSLSAPIPKSATERETELLHAKVSQLQALVGELQKRLKPLLLQELPESDVNEKAEEFVPPLANAIRQSRYVVESTIYVADNTLARLDL